METVGFGQLQITTDRLQLVPSKEAFAEVTFREFTKEIAKYMYPQPYASVDDARKALVDRYDRMKDGIDITLTALDKKTQDFVGRVSLLDVNTETPEIGIWIKKSAHGHGYGREAVKALIDWANQHLNFQYLRYPVDRNNVQSMKLAQVMGGVNGKEYHNKNMLGEPLDTIEYRIYKPKTLL